MGNALLLGLFHEATPAADTIDRLRTLGIADDCVTVMSGIPYRPEILGRPHYRGRVGRLALVGALLGLMLGLFLTVGIWLLYPLVQGGQPIVPIPPMLLILFEVTMLGTMWTAFFSLLLGNRFPVFRSQPYDPRVTEGHIGVLVEVDEKLADSVEAVFRANGAHHLERVVDERPAHAPIGSAWSEFKARLIVAVRGPDPGQRGFWLSAIAIVMILGAVTMLMAFDVISLSFPTQMEHQVSVGFEQGPRLAAPAAAIPVQGPVLIADQPATELVAASPDSLQRGKVLYGVTCIVCHGETGTGEGKLSGLFTPKPVDLTLAPIQNLANEVLFMIVTQGVGAMPSMAENLSAQDRWDVINQVRSLKK